MKEVHKYTPALSKLLYKGKSKKSGEEMLKRAVKKKPGYKIPKTPKVSGIGWGP